MTETSISTQQFESDMRDVAEQVRAAYARLRAAEAAAALPARPVRRPILSILRRQAA